MVEICMRPLNGPDNRSWWGKLMGEIYNPIMPPISGTDALYDADHMNRRYAAKWHCKIARVHFPRKEAEQS